VCENGATCLVNCNGALDCAWETCQGTAMSCPGGVIVCNRACP